MSRPRLFEERAAINVYLHAGQKEKLTQVALRRGVSVSEVVRRMIEAMT